MKSQDLKILWAIFTFFWKTIPYGKIFKILLRKFSPPHRSTLLCWNFVKFIRREIGEIVRWPSKKISAASQTAATAWVAPKIRQGQPTTMCSQCARFHPSRFTFGGVIAERVNTVFCPLEYFHDSPEAMVRFGRIIIVKCLEEAVISGLRSSVNSL